MSPALIFVDITPTTQADRQKLARALQVLTVEDGQLEVRPRADYAHVVLRLHPAEAGSGSTFEDTTTGGTIPKRFMTSVERGITDAMANGILRGYPIVDVRVDVHDGSYHDADSTEDAFRTAAGLAFQDAARKAHPRATTTACLVLGCLAAPRRIVAAVRRPCRNHTTATAKPEHPGPCQTYQGLPIANRCVRLRR